MADDDKTPAEDTEDGFDSDFDAERAKRTIRALRADKRSLAEEVRTLKADKADLEKRATDAEKVADDARKELAADRRASILREFDIDEDLAEEFLSGDLTLDELRRKAERLAGRKTPKPDPKPEGETPEDDDAGDGKPDEEAAPAAPATRPKPRLTPGHGSEATDEPDLDAIARAARRR
jgi:hypothetical protein